ncbi:MAG: LysR family transcriptional regulator [Chloroflexi bacterium]|nr:LysR family transcriptional regulator [Chloroflexota bacterium]
MEIGQLEAFLQVVQYHSFSHAAEALELTQPSLSARILSLEREMGEPLFHRMGRGVRLTDAGRAFMPYVERALQSLKDARDAVDATHHTSTGKLRIGSARAICAYVLPHILETFHAAHPGIDVAIKTGRSSEVLEMLLAEEVQVGLTRTMVHQDIESRHLYDEHVVLVTHPTHPFARAGVASIYAVAHEPLILYDKDSTYFVLINRVVREAGIVPNVQMDLDSIEATKRMIERGLGLSFLPYNSIAAEVEQGSLAAVPLREGHDVVLPTSVMVRKAGSQGAVVQAFLDLLYTLYPEGLAAASRDPLAERRRVAVG